MSIIKKILDNFFRLIEGKRIFYGFFYYLHTRALKGMDHGHMYGLVDKSGEALVIQLLLEKKSCTIIDGGAHFGEYSIMCHNILGSKCNIYSFEPSSTAYHKLTENVTGFSNITPVNCALSNNDDDLTLYYDESGSVMASVFPLNYDHYKLNFDQKESVKAVSLDGYIASQKIAEINLLKLDLEGFEYTALTGAARAIETGKIEMIQFEMGRPNVDTHTFFKDFFLLLHEKYQIYRILYYGFSPIPQYSTEYEIFLGCNYLAIQKSSSIRIPDALLI